MRTCFQSCLDIKSTLTPIHFHSQIYGNYQLPKRGKFDYPANIGGTEGTEFHRGFFGCVYADCTEVATSLQDAISARRAQAASRMGVSRAVGPFREQKGVRREETE